MCYQITEIYSACRCLYYQHAIDRCASHDRHPIQRRTILVGYACAEHSEQERRKGQRQDEQIYPPKDNSSFELARESDSDDSDLSETESTVSIASSTTTVHIDALETIFRKILYFQDLRCLWPQVVHKSRSRKSSIRNIERFLRRYAGDLAKLATKSVADRGPENPEWEIQIKASRFVQRSCLNIAQRILEAHFRICEPEIPEEVSEPEPERLVEVRGKDESGDDDAFNFIYFVAEPFLFETDPILYLQANVKAFVSMRSPLPIAYSLSYSIKLIFENTISRLTKPPVSKDKKRITWKCKCGRQLYDDFLELRPGAVKNLETWLRDQNSQDTHTLERAASDETGHSQNQKHVLTQLWRGFWAIPTDLLKRSELPRHHRKPHKDIEIGTCPRGSDNTRAQHNFVLLCVPFQRWAIKLSQAEICRVNSDQEFFRILRHYYATQRGQSAWTRLRRVRSINFVKFEVYRSRLVDVQTCPSIPLAEAHTDYAYEPRPAEIIPPIGPNHLMHLFEHPEDAETVPVLYRKIPKKLRERLEACPRNGSSPGWGLHFAEGMNWFVVFVYGCVGFILSLVAAIVWATIQGDVQGAFAIASFMIAFLMFCGGIARSEING